MFSVDKTTTTIPLDITSVREADFGESDGLPGITFTNGQGPGQGFGPGTLDLTYKVEVTDNKMLISDIKALTGTGSASAVLKVKPGDDGQEFSSFFVGVHPDQKLTDTVDFNKLVKSLKVNLNLEVSQNGRTVKLSTSFSQKPIPRRSTPEPSSIFGLGTLAGLGLIGGLKRKLSKK